METYIINSGNVSAALSELKKGGKHFIITVDVPFPGGTVELGAGSILTFRGGSFTTGTSTTVKLKSCQIFAGAYPIFHKNIKITGLESAEVRAEWFRSADDASDADYINRAITAAKGCPVVLETRTYELGDSIRFIPDSIRQTLICPGTLSVANASGSIPAIDINTGSVRLQINKIQGASTATGYKGIGIKFSVYNENSDIEVTTMRNLEKGFFVQPDVRGKHPNKPEEDTGGVQYCRIKFGSIYADYCFYIDVFSTAQYLYKDTNDKASLPELAADGKLSTTALEALNWFNENQISGGLMQGKYGVYILSPNEFKITDGTKEYANTINPANVNNVMNGLKFENISFEGITKLALRLRSVQRSVFLNLQMFNSMPQTGKDPNDPTDFTPWIDLENINEVRMTFNSFVLPNRIKVGNRCKNSYIYGPILDNPANYGSHFDTLGIDTLYEQSGSSMIEKSQMYVTNSVVPYNMAKTINVSAETTMYIKDLLPNLKDGTTSTSQISLPVLASALKVNITKPTTLTIELTGIDRFAPCLYTVDASIFSGGKLNFKTTGYLGIEGGTYTPENTQDNKPAYTIKTVSASGIYAIQWLSNWSLRITKL